MSAVPSWLKSPIKGILLDISGVLFNSTDNGPKLIDGSLEAVRRLKASGIPVRFCTNESQLSQSKIVERLQNLGFPIESHEVFSPIPAVKMYLKEHDLRPYIIVHDKAIDAFSDVNQQDPNCVLLGDAGKNFSYEKLNNAFHLLLKTPMLISMGYGKFYKENDNLVLDVGPFSKALECACGGDIEPVIIGKPSSRYFLTALQDMKVKPEEAIMIGDDIVSDIGASQKCGMRGIQVRTGKYRPSDEPHPHVTPSGYVDDLKEAIDVILMNK